MIKKGKGISTWPSFLLGVIGAAWLFQSEGLLQLTLPLGPIAAVWASLTFILLIKQIRGRLQ